MRSADYAKVRRLWKSTKGIGLDECDARERVSRYLRRNPGLSFVAVEGKQIIGAALCGHDSGRRGYLHHLAVSREFRRRGIGSTLVSRCLGALRKRGIGKCNAFLYGNNAAGGRFWRRRGWKVRDELRFIQRKTLGRSPK